MGLLGGNFMNKINHRIKRAYFESDWLVWEYEDGIICSVPPNIVNGCEEWDWRKLDAMHENLFKKRTQISINKLI
jgi:hypothetical protein